MSTAMISFNTSRKPVNTDLGHCLNSVDSDDEQFGFVKPRNYKKQTEPRRGNNNGLNYIAHSDSTRVDVLYSHFVHKTTLEDIALEHGVKYNTVRNFIKSFQRECGMHYKYQNLDESNPIVTEMETAESHENIGEKNCV